MLVVEVVLLLDGVAGVLELAALINRQGLQNQGKKSESYSRSQPRHYNCLYSESAI